MPHIPLSPDELPPQHFGVVWVPPPIPEGREIGAVRNSEGPILGIPKERPRRCTFIAGAEWSWSPMNNRFAAYYLSKSARKWWVLWEGMLNENEIPWKWEYYATYAMQAVGVTKEAAAWHLLEHSWRKESEEGWLDQFHMIDSTGELDAAQLQSIAARVWGCDSSLA